MKTKLILINLILALANLLAYFYGAHMAINMFAAGWILGISFMIAIQ